MLAHAMLLPVGVTRDDTGHDGRVMTSEDRALSLLLTTAWAARTGRVLRPVPVTELSPEELVNFWADDQLEQPLDAPVREWPQR
jgi:hypothetical protein